MASSRVAQCRWQISLAAAVMLALACTCGGLLPLAQTEEAGPASPPDETAVAAGTTYPTPRPLAETHPVEGVYRNDVAGVSLEYPAGWDILSQDASGDELLVLQSADEAVIVSLTSTYLYADEDLGNVASGYFQELPELIGFSSGETLSADATYALADGTPAWRAIGQAPVAGGAPLRYEVVAAERSGRVFLLTSLVYASDYPDYQADLDDIRRSLGIHEPTPYGVPRENAFFLADVEPDTFDPALWQSSADGIIGDLFSGLVQLDASLRPIPDLAASWDISADGTVYTFHLRQDVTFHNGEPFTAQDVVFSWERACDPALESDTALTYLGDILGVAERIAGEADRIAGLRVVDDFTLEVTLDGVKAYFLAKLAYPTSWIVDESSVQDIEETPIGTGPFVLVQHVEDQVIIVARNPAYHRGFVPLEYIVYLLYPGPLIRLYEAGEIDVAYIDDDLLVRAEDPSDPLYGDPQPTGELCTWYAQFDASRPPFNDSLVRQAFAQAVDREQYVEVMGEGQGVEARGLYPPGLPGYSEDLRPLPFDPQAAQDLLRQSSFAGPQGLPEIVLSTSGAGLDLSPSASLLVDMWRQNLGVTVRVEQIDSDSFYDQLYAGNHGHIILTGWCADYPDPENFADVLFHTGSPQNFGDYSNPDLDALLERARVETDLEERLSLYRQAEQILAEDAAAVFLQHSSVYYTLVKTYVHGYVSTPIGIAQHMNLSIVHGE